MGEEEKEEEEEEEKEEDEDEDEEVEEESKSQRISNVSSVIDCVHSRKLNSKLDVRPGRFFDVVLIKASSSQLDSLFAHVRRSPNCRFYRTRTKSWTVSESSSSVTNHQREKSVETD
ncbi:hypothetical protein HZH66_012794 [Vespula vulgaris]|uniref:Uncharacterized protein n=1 Tax=Vespula vulgaris TaxID=7454 RepID=A0A834JAJ3_VESVU|nr:hypothetical protein HZH66_012794 [Vespula vulgaris]